MRKLPFFPPSDPADWQNAYTENHVFEDSSTRTSSFFIPIIILLITPTIISLFSFVIQLVNTQVDRLASPYLIFIIVGFALIVSPLFFITVFSGYLFNIAESFLRFFYKLPDGIDVKQIIKLRIFGRAPLPPPLSDFVKVKSVLIKNGKLDSQDNWVTKIGGPVKLRIEPGNAVYLERGSSFSRVVGPDSVFIELNETVRTVLNLGPQSEEISATAWTRDGINITIKAKGEYSLGLIDRGENENNTWFKFDPGTVCKAVNQALVNGGEGHEWIKSARERTSNALVEFVTDRYLEEIFTADRENRQLLSTNTMNELISNINAHLQRDGLNLSRLQIIDVVTPEQIKHQRIKIWGSGQKNQEVLALSETKAHELHARKQVLAEMLRDLVFTLANGLERTGSTDSDEKLLASIYAVLNQGMKEHINYRESKTTNTPDGTSPPDLGFDILGEGE